MWAARVLLDYTVYKIAYSIQWINENNEKGCFPSTSAKK